MRVFFSDEGNSGTLPDHTGGLPRHGIIMFPTMRETTRSRCCAHLTSVVPPKSPTPIRRRLPHRTPSSPRKLCAEQDCSRLLKSAFCPNGACDVQLGL